jgi:hypothetical protein
MAASANKRIKTRKKTHADINKKNSLHALNGKRLKE